MRTGGKRKKDKYELINNSVPLKRKTNFSRHWEDKMDFVDLQFNFLLCKTREQMIAEKKMNEVKQRLFLSVQKKNMEKKLEKQKKKSQLLKRHQYIQSAFNNKMMLDMVLKNKRFMYYLMTIRGNKKISNLQDNFSKPENTINSLSNSQSKNLYSEIDANQVSENLSPIFPNGSTKKLKNNYFITQVDFESEKNTINNNSNYKTIYYNSCKRSKILLQKKEKDVQISSSNFDDKQKRLYSISHLIKNVTTDNNSKKKILMFNQKNSSINVNKCHILSDSLKKNKKVRIITSPIIVKLKTMNNYDKTEIEKNNGSQYKRENVYNTINYNLFSNERKKNKNNNKNIDRSKTVANHKSEKKQTFKDIFINICQK